MNIMKDMQLIKINKCITYALYIFGKMGIMTNLIEILLFREDESKTMDCRFMIQNQFSFDVFKLFLTYN